MIMKRLIASMVLLIAIVMLTGCSSLKPIESRHYYELVDDGVITKPIEHKNIWAASILNFLIPGVGHYYLEEWGAGTGLLVSNIFWPLSPIWATPAAMIDTRNVNKRYTLEHYLYGNGKSVVTKMEKEKCFKKAIAYVQLQQQVDRNDISKGELVQYLIMQEFALECIMSIDLAEIQTKTNCQIVGQKINETSPEPNDDGSTE